MDDELLAVLGYARALNVERAFGNADLDGAVGPFRDQVGDGHLQVLLGQGREVLLELGAIGDDDAAAPAEGLDGLFLTDDGGDAVRRRADDARCLEPPVPRLANAVGRVHHGGRGGAVQAGRALGVRQAPGSVEKHSHGNGALAAHGRTQHEVALDRCSERSACACHRLAFMR